MCWRRDFLKGRSVPTHGKIKNDVAVANFCMTFSNNSWEVVYKIATHGLVLKKLKFIFYDTCATGYDAIAFLTIHLMDTKTCSSSERAF